MKKVITICIVSTLLSLATLLNATPITLIEAISIERVSGNTFNLTLLYNEYLPDSNPPLPACNNWQYYDIGISAEPISGQQDFAIGEILVPGEYVADMWAWDWDWNGLQFRAANQTADFPTNVPLFSFTYTGSASEFIIYDMNVSDSVPVGNIAIPEPATLALLGLGGLLLSKKK